MAPLLTSVDESKGFAGGLPSRDRQARRFDRWPWHALDVPPSRSEPVGLDLLGGFDPRRRPEQWGFKSRAIWHVRVFYYYLSICYSFIGRRYEVRTRRKDRDITRGPRYIAFPFILEFARGPCIQTARSGATGKEAIGASFAATPETSPDRNVFRGGSSCPVCLPALA